MQLCGLAVPYALTGDHRFRTALRRVVADKPVPDSPWLGEADLIELDGSAGFRLAAEARGDALAGREWECDDGSFVETACELLGEAEVRRVLDEGSATSPGLRRFRDAWRVELPAPPGSTGETHAQRLARLGVDDVVRAAETGEPSYLLRGWDRHASDADLRAVAERMFACREPAALARYLRAFSARAMPEFDERLLGLLVHPDEDVRRRACTAAAQNAHPSVRAFALEHVGEPASWELFTRNYRPGDEDLIASALTLPDDEDVRHWAFMDLRKILKANPSARCGPLGTLAWRWTPCSACRFDAAELLIGRGEAPAWLAEECADDGEPDTRGLVAGR